MIQKYGYTVLGMSKSQWDKAKEKPIDLPSNFTISWSDDESDGFVSGIGYGIGMEFHTPDRLKDYIRQHGWSLLSDNPNVI